MNFQLQHEPFQTFSQWYTWRLGLDLANIPAALPAQVSSTGILSLHSLFKVLLTDLYTTPQGYGLPSDAFEAYTEPRLRMAEDKLKAAKIRTVKLKARKAIDTGILDFLYQIGQSGELQEQNLRLERSFYDRMLADKIKKSGNKSIPCCFESLGFSFAIGDEVIVSYPRYHDVLAALTHFARVCASIPENGFYFFRRCDFEVFNQKRLPAFEDGLHLATKENRVEVEKTNALLTERKFKREVFVADAGAGFRLRYNKRNDQIVYWCRLMSWDSPDPDHNLRWKFESDLTLRLFNQLDTANPGLSDRVFDGIKKCEYCYENCIARVVVERKGVSQECCSEAGWNAIGESSVDFDDLRLVLSTLDDLVQEKKG